MKKELGITKALKPFRAWTNAKRRFKRKIGYESEAGRLIRNGLPKPGRVLGGGFGRDWNGGRNWEYMLMNMFPQLSIYAAVHDLRVATILYPSLDHDAKESRLSLHDSLREQTVAQIHVRPVHLELLERLVMSRGSMAERRKRRAYAEKLAFGPVQREFLMSGMCEACLPKAKRD